MGTYIFQPKNYVHSNYLTKLASLRSIILIVQDALHLQKSEIICLLLKVEHYEAIFYSFIHFEERIYTPVMARGPPSERVQEVY